MSALSGRQRQPSHRASRWLEWAGWAAIALLWLLLIAVLYRITLTHPTGGGDFTAYYKGARSLTTGSPLYTGIDGDMPYLYPPLLALLLIPLGALADFRMAAVIWLVINLGVLALTLALLSRTMARRRSQMALWLAAALYSSTLQTLWFGQIGIALLALAVGTWLAYREGRPILAGILLALAAWLKVYPVLALLYFVWRRDWRVVISTLVTGAILGLVQLAAVGSDQFRVFLTVILPRLATTGNAPRVNNSILGFAYRLFAPVAQSIPLADSPPLLLLTRLLLTALVVGGTLVVLARRRSVQTDRRFDLEYALVTLGALLLGTLHGVHAMLPALLVFFLLLRHAPPGKRRRQTALCLLAGLLINFNLFLELGYVHAPSDITLPALLLSTPFFGLMLLWLLLIAADLRAATSQKG